MAQIVVGLRKIRINQQRSLVLPNGSIETLQPGQCERQGVVCPRGYVVDLDRTLEQTDGLFESALLDTDGAQAAQGIEMTGVRFEHDFVEMLRFRRAALPMKLDRLQERL